MRTVIIGLFVLVMAGACLMLAETGEVAADSHPRKSQWQYQCFQADGVAQVTERANKMGQQGWELVTSAGTKGNTLWCFKRPLWKD